MSEVKFDVQLTREELLEAAVEYCVRKKKLPPGAWTMNRLRWNVAFEVNGALMLFAKDKPVEFKPVEGCNHLFGKAGRCLRCNLPKEEAPPVKLTSVPDPEPEPEACRRCVECEGLPHHWMHGCVPFDEETGVPEAEYGCKHCPALGDPCDACGADPEQDTEPSDPNCPKCDGDGIAFVKYRTDEESDAD